MPRAGRDQAEWFLPPIIRGRASCILTSNNAIALASQTVYAIALDIAPSPRTIARVLFRVSLAATGAISGEVAIGTSPNDLLTDVAATTTVTVRAVASLSAVLGSIGDKNIALAYTIPAFTQPWLLIHAITTTGNAQVPTTVVNIGGTTAVRSLVGQATPMAVNSTYNLTAVSAGSPLMALGTV